MTASRRVLRLNGDFTGQVPTGLIGNDAFQEVDIAGITRPQTQLCGEGREGLAQVVHGNSIWPVRASSPCLWLLPKNVLQVRPGRLARA